MIIVDDLKALNKVQRAAFAASFFFISVACDYRYLTFFDVSAMAGVARMAATRRPG